MRRRINATLEYWPIAVLLSIFLSLIGVIALVAAILAPSGGDKEFWFRLIAFCGLVPGLFGLGFTLSDAGGELVRGDKGRRRKPPLSRVAWCVRPPTFRGARMTSVFAGGWIFFATMVYAAVLPLLVVKRLIELRREPGPLTGDLISMRAPGGSNDYWTSQVLRLNGDVVKIRTLAVSGARTFHALPEEFTAPYPERSISRAAYSSCDPKFLWRGPTRFWNPGSRSGDTYKSWPDEYSEIERASHRLEELERQGKI